MLILPLNCAAAFTRYMRQDMRWHIATVKAAFEASQRCEASILRVLVAILRSAIGDIIRHAIIRYLMACRATLFRLANV